MLPAATDTDTAVATTNYLYSDQTGSRSGDTKTSREVVLACLDISVSFDLSPGSLEAGTQCGFSGFQSYRVSGFNGVERCWS